MAMSGLKIGDEIKTLVSQGFQNSKSSKKLQAAILRLNDKVDKMIVQEVISGSDRPPDLFRRLRSYVVEQFKSGCCWVLFEFDYNTGESSPKQTLALIKYTGPGCTSKIMMPAASAHVSLKTALSSVGIAMEINDLDDYTISDFLKSKKSNIKGDVTKVDGMDYVKGKLLTEVLHEKLPFISYDEYNAMANQCAKKD